MRKSQVNSFKLYSYRNVFNDGDDRFHPGFKIRRTLLVLTKTKPFHKRYIPLTGEEIQSPHLQTTKCYLTTADNQQAKRYNNARAGELILPKENVVPLLPLLKISPFSTQLSMSDQTKVTPAAGKAALIHLLTMASGTSRALLVNPTVDGFPNPDSGEELPQWLNKINAQLATPIDADAVFGHYSNFLVKGVDAAAKAFWDIIEKPCTLVHVRAVTDILVNELTKEGSGVNFDAAKFTEWFEKQTDQTIALATVHQAAFATGEDRELAVMEIGSTLHVAADPADAAAALQTSVDNPVTAAETTPGVVNAETVATELVAEATAPDAAAIPATPVAEAPVEDVETTDGGSQIQAIADQGGLIRAAAIATEAGAEVLEALANMNAAASQVASAGAKQLRATAAVLQAGGAPTASVELPATATPVEEPVAA